ncbi:MAG: tetratricopeptide repeat protein [Candidatus Binatia bacterium]
MKHVVIAISVAWSMSLAVAAQAGGDATVGVRLFDDEQWSAAQRFFENFTQEHPTDPIGAFYLGRTFFEQGHYEPAIEWLERAVLLETHNSNYHLWLGRAYGYQAQRVSVLWQLPLALRVKKHFEKAVELDPDNVDARADLTEYYLKAPRIIGGGKDKAEAQAHEISRRNLQEGLRVWRMIAEEEAKVYVQTNPDSTNKSAVPTQE